MYHVTKKKNPPKNPKKPPPQKNNNKKPPAKHNLPSVSEPSFAVVFTFKIGIWWHSQEYKDNCDFHHLPQNLCDWVNILHRNLTHLLDGFYSFAKETGKKYLDVVYVLKIKLK